MLTSLANTRHWSCSRKVFKGIIFLEVDSWLSEALLFACLLIYFYFSPWLCNTYCAGFFQLHYASKQMWWLLQKGVLVYLHENTATLWYRDSAFSLICLNVDIILRTWLHSLLILLTIMNNNIPQFSKITLIKRNAAWSSTEAIRWQTEVASKT